MRVFLPILVILAFIGTSYAQHASDPKLYLITVATAETDGFKRLQKTAEAYGHELHVLGLGEKWQGGTMEGLGGGQKVRLLRQHFTDNQLDPNTIVMFIDAYDVLILEDPITILRRFLLEFPTAKILFGAEPYCWPDSTLAPKYPLVTFGERYLNSGLFMGYITEIERLITIGGDLYDFDDDQLYYTKIYLDPKLRAELSIELDSLSRIFQNLNGAVGQITIEHEDDGTSKLYNKEFNTHPAIVHGNGPSKISLNYLENYVAGAYNKLLGCTRCANVKLTETLSSYPSLTLAVFIGKPIPFVEEFFASVKGLLYPKEKIDLVIFNNQKRSDKEVEKFVAENGKAYRTVIVRGIDAGICEYTARNDAFHHALEQKSDYIFSLDADVHLNPTALVHLVQRARANDLRMLTPVVNIPGKLFTNFWGAVSPNGYYERANDYTAIVEGDRKGIWNVPFAASAILIAAEKLPFFMNAYYYDQKLDPDMSFAKFCRDKGHFMYVSNEENYGILLVTDQFANLPDEIINADLYDYPANPALWEKRYIHPEYRKYLDPDFEVPQACPDVYDYPLVSLRFCKEIIEIMEHSNAWSDGSNFDKRLDGGYENVPTRDIHMNQVNFDNQWLKVVDDYVAPMQEKVFTGYFARPVKSSMMFVVRYKPEEQASLRPHHDASTYSIDIALNKKGVDYEGGGVRYHRYNCTVPADEPGWTMMFPGRLTHLHEGLPTTKGTRYILVSFLNP
uniref:procollagen-lysine 5-dioxygenase n=1 Tax=Panagrellus redivivus TaxID=6233 RepID=A0A7E4UXT6_PANRE